jgi:hypothetical protein
MNNKFERNGIALNNARKGETLEILIMPNIKITKKNKIDKRSKVYKDYLNK